MFNRNRNFIGARIVLMVGLVIGLIGVTPGSASADATIVRSENSGFSVHVQTPSYPVGIASGDTKLVPFSINEAEGISGTITSRTYQFFTQYDVPLSESHGPFRANISINSNGTNGWSELVYLPKTVADKARAIKDYAIVLKTTFKGKTQSGKSFSADSSLLLLLPPDNFIKESPLDGALVPPGSKFLAWTASVGAVDYEYCYDNIDNNLCDTNWTGTYDPFAVIQNLPSELTFYWQVRANNTSGTTYANNGDWWEFTTATSLPGRLDPTFDGDGLVTTFIGSSHDEARAVAIQPDGKILVTGLTRTTDTDFFVARYNPDGALDSSFDMDGIVTTDFGASEVSRAIVVQTDGKIVAAGYSEIGPFAGQAKIVVARFNPDGSLDSSFSMDGKVITDLDSSHEISTGVAIQSDGKIVVVGYKNVGINNNDIVILRYNTDGSLDLTFNGDGIATTEIGLGSDEIASSIALQPDGKILVGGETYNGTNTDFALLRFNNVGTLDSSFDTDGIVTTDFGLGFERGGFVTIQPDGKIVLGGSSDDEFLVARYTNTGALDSSFDLDGKALSSLLNIPTARDLVLQSDGKIVIAGYSEVDNDFAVVRFRSDGSMDPTFDSDGIVITDFGLNQDDLANSVRVQTDGKIVVAGYRYIGGSNYDIAIARYIGGMSSTPTPTPTATVTVTPTSTIVPTATNTVTATATQSKTPTPTFTPTSTSTPTHTPTLTPTNTATSTPPPAPITIGETSVLTSTYSGIGNQLVAQQVILSQSATIQSLSYYVSTAGGQLRLGIYNNNGSNPGTLVAQTAAFTPVVGWNTQPVLTPTLLPAGTYWLAFLPQSNTLTGRITFSGTGRYYGYTFGALPATYSTSPSSAAFRFSFYATLSLGAVPTSMPTHTPTFTPTIVPTATSSPTASFTPTNSNTLTPTPTRTPTRTPTPTNTPVVTSTFTNTPINTATQTVTQTPTVTSTITPTRTLTFTPTLTSSPASTSTPATVTIGETSVLTSTYSGIGNQLVAQQVILSQSATIQSLSYYVSTAGGQLRLGIYNNNGSNPGTLVAETAAFTPVVGWNTQPVLTPTLLPAGTYWLAFLPQSNTLTGRITFSGTGRYYGYTFGALPATFSTSPSSAAFHFSVYATLTTALPTATPTATSTSAINCAVVNGTGSATLFQPYRQYNCERYAYAVGIADFNNDGDKDVALSVRTGTTGSPSSLLVFHQDNNGNLSQPLIYSGGNRAEHMAVGDVNNDGLDDVVTVDFSDNTISLFSQTGAGELAERVTYATNSGPDAIAIGDVNNDGLNDVAVAHHTSAMIGVFIQKADGTLDAMTTYPSVSAGFDDIAIGDVNGDGLNDVVKMNGQGLNSNIMVYRQNANGSLNTSLNYSIAACTSTCLSNGIAIGDVTEDGRLDVILSYGGNRPNSNIAVFEQGVNGDLQPSVSYPAYDTPGAIEVADVNSDGLEDVVVVHEVWLQAGVFLQQNDGTLGIETLYPVPNSNAEDLDIGDINGDQLPDLAIADSAGLIVLYRNANPPSPTYTPSSTFTPTVTNTPTRTSAPTATATLSATITLGETTILSANYSGMGNRLAAQQVTLSQSATIQSLSYYVSTAGGQLRLGIYNNNGSNPGTLVAETAAFTPVAGWNTQPVLTPVLLPAGTYWLAFLPQNNSLAGRVTAAGVGRYYSYTFGSMPSSYSTSPTTGVFRFSFYATLSTVTASPTVTLTPTPTLCFDC